MKVVEGRLILDLMISVCESVCLCQGGSPCGV